MCIQKAPVDAGEAAQRIAHVGSQVAAEDNELLDTGRLAAEELGAQVGNGVEAVPVVRVRRPLKDVAEGCDAAVAGKTRW